MGEVEIPERPPQKQEWTRRQALILQALARAQGPMRNGDIAAVTGVQSTTVNMLLHRFVEYGIVRQVARGEYELVPTASK